MTIRMRSAFTEIVARETYARDSTKVAVREQLPCLQEDPLGKRNILMDYLLLIQGVCGSWDSSLYSMCKV